MEILKLLPLIVLFVAAVIFVWRGMSVKPDPRHNRAKGGGPQWKIWK